MELAGTVWAVGGTFSVVMLFMLFIIAGGDFGAELGNKAPILWIAAFALAIPFWIVVAVIASQEENRPSAVLVIDDDD